MGRMMLTIPVLCALTLPGAAQQPQPRFEVASIRPVSPSTTFRGSPLNIRRDTFSATNHSVLQLIRVAYGLLERQILDGPGWIRAERFNVTARMSMSTDGPRDQALRMLQALLADRFKLRLHKETRNLPVYALVPDSGGVKPGRDPEGQGGGIMLMARGWTRIQRVKSDALAGYLTGIVDRPVVDKSNLDRELTFDLMWTPAESVSAADAIPGCPPDLEEMAKRLKFTLTDRSCPSSVFTALREQIGLRLEAQNAPTEVLVIDSIEMPTEN